ncbi:MAG: hypothetical protein JST26_03220 [Bacteroidetes bacterium]|nr:hypothetical protein [Bacteroidota bacterium]
MSAIVPTLIEKNKEAYSKAFYIESIYLSHLLVNKALKQIIKEEYADFKTTGKYKNSKLVKALEEAYKVSPAMKSKLKKQVFNEITLFNEHFKSVLKELKYQYPETKIKLTASQGMKVIAMLNTTLSRIRNNRSVS